MPTYEEVISSSAGWGLYNNILYTMCGFCFMAEGSMTAAISNILPVSAAEVNLNQKNIVGFLCTHTAGMAVGSVVGGVAMDATGRRCVVPLALMIAFTGTTVWAFAGNTEFIFAGMLVLGVGLGMHSLALRIYLMEMLPPQSRGGRVALLSIFWAIGFFCATALQLLLEPLAEKDPSGFRPTSWRVVVSLGACFAAVVACTCGSLGPSTRWLLAQGRTAMALDHLRRMYAINQSKHADTFPPPRLRGLVAEFPEAWRLRDDSIVCSYMVVRMGKQIAECFRRPYVLLTLTAVLVRVPILNGMWTDMAWMSANLYYPCVPDLERVPELDSLERLPGAMRLRQDVYRNVMILAAIVCITSTMLHFLVDLIGHRVTLFIFFAWAVGALVCVVIPVPMVPPEAICCVFFGSLLNCEITFGIISAEMYPTYIRGTANGLIPVLGRTASIVVNVFLHRTDCLPVTYALIAACGMAMILLWALPELAKKPMREAVPAAAAAGAARESESSEAEVPEAEGGVGGRRPGATAQQDNSEVLREMGVDVDQMLRDDEGAGIPLRHSASAPQPSRLRARGTPARHSAPHQSVAPSRKQEARRHVTKINIFVNSEQRSGTERHKEEPVELVIVSDKPTSSDTRISTLNVERRGGDAETIFENRSLRRDTSACVEGFTKLSIEGGITQNKESDANFPETEHGDVCTNHKITIDSNEVCTYKIVTRSQGTTSLEVTVEPGGVSETALGTYHGGKEKSKSSLSTTHAQTEETPRNDKDYFLTYWDMGSPIEYPLYCTCDYSDDTDGLSSA